MVSFRKPDSISRWVLNNPEEAVYISSAELANKAEVHASTVVRLAHKIGYEGFPAMRNHIRENVQSRPTSFPTQQRKLDQIKTSSNLSTLIEAEILALSSVINSVTQNQIDLAAKVLANAGTVFIVGRGSAAAPKHQPVRHVVRAPCGCLHH